LIGNFADGAEAALQRGKFVDVSVPIGMLRAVSAGLLSLMLFLLAVGLLIMMYPILCKVKFETLHLMFRKREIWTQIAFSIFMNWIIAPFLMVSWLETERNAAC
jgi:ACR3 family arsenite transporter